MAGAPENRGAFFLEGTAAVCGVLRGEADGLQVALVTDRIFAVHRIGGLQVVLRHAGRHRGAARDDTGDLAGARLQIR